jgi:hypothetical protein
MAAAEQVKQISSVILQTGITMVWTMDEWNEKLVRKGGKKPRQKRNKGFEKRSVSRA